jgi:hypothetical protein
MEGGPRRDGRPPLGRPLPTHNTNKYHSPTVLSSLLVLQLSATIHWLPWVPRGASQIEWVCVYQQLARSVDQWT